MLLLFNNNILSTTSIKNVTAMRDILRPASTRLIDVIVNTDSNGLFGGWGWDHGWQNANLNAFGASTMYATGIHAFNEAGGGGQNVGYGNSSFDTRYNRFRSGGVVATATTLPAAISTVWDNSRDPGTHSINHLQMAWWRSRADPASDQAKQHGLSLGALSPLGLGSQAQEYQLFGALFNSTDFPSAATAAFAQVNGGSNQFFTGFALTDAGLTRVPATPIYKQALVTQTTTYEMRRQSPAETLDTAYPFAGIFQRIVNKDMTTGHAVSMGYSVGSSTSTNCLAYWNSMGATSMAYHIAAVLYQQTQKSLAPYLLVEFAFGVNDGSAGISSATFKSNMLALIALYRTAFAAALVLLGVSAGGARLRFSLRVSPPSQSGDANLSGYRTVCSEIALTNTDTSFVDMNSITSFTELNTTTIPCYANAGVDFFHMKTNAYNDDTYTTLMGRVLSQVLT